MVGLRATVTSLVPIIDIMKFVARASDVMQYSTLSSLIDPHYLLAAGSGAQKLP